MRSNKWTAEQLDAINTRDCDLLVAAAAGTGKTAVLVERIINRITDEKDPVDIDRLLAVTFTKAAASEMRERISAAIACELNKNPDSRHLNRQLTLLPRAAITTLHSFCLEVLHQYFYRLDLDPVFRVTEDTEAALLRLEALEELFDDYYTSGDTGFLALVDAYGGAGDDSYLQEMVLRLHEFAASNPWPEHWLRSLAGSYNGREEGVPLEKLVWGQTILESLELQLQGCRFKLERAAKLSACPGGPAVYLPNLADDLALINDISMATGHSWEELHKAVNQVKFSKLKACRAENIDEHIKKRVQTLRDSVKNIISGIKDSFFSRSPEELAADLKKAAPFVETLAALVVEFNARFCQAKAAKSLVDFSDLEHYCLQILMDEGSSPDKIVPSTAAYELREHFAEVLIDEYQDINGVQETILQLISRKSNGCPNCFMVGDVKQSIYRFRLADPALFMKKYHTYPRAKGMPEQGIDLTRNFRSRREVVDTVNFLFRQLMTARVGETAYDRKAELVGGAEFPPATAGLCTAAGPTELYLLEKNPAAQAYHHEDTEDQSGEADEEGNRIPAVEDLDDLDELDAVQREARLAARRIQEMVTGKGNQPGPEFCVCDKKTGYYRPVRYRDIVVLLRTARKTAGTFIEEFRLAGIPAYADLDTGYFKAIEVETMLALLKVIDNPRQDIPMAAVLRSPIVGLNAEDLASVRLRDPRGDFYDAVKKSAELGEKDVDTKLRGFLARLENWRTLARQGPLSDLIWRLYNETGYYAYTGGMPGGSQRQANLRALHDRARQYEATAFRGLFRFLRFIEKFRETGNDLGSARALGENEDIVRIISIHKSKGLEFPVVIAAGLGKQFNTSDLRQKALFHKELGLGLPVVDIDLCSTYPTIAQTAIKQRLQLELLAEEMRILYVALTRAREKLILVGSVKGIAKSAGYWCENVAHHEWPLPDPDLAAAKNYLDWLCPAVARHQDGQILRQLALCEESPVDFMARDPSRWQVSINKPDEPLFGMSEPFGVPEPAGRQSGLIESVRMFRPVEAEGGCLAVLNKNLSWQYPYRMVVGKPAKATVTELKRHFAGDLTDESFAPYQSCLVSRPRFFQKASGLSAPERGLAMHLVMQHLRLEGDLSLSGLREQIKIMTAGELLTGEQAEAVDLPAVERFFRSPLGRRITAAAEVKREIPFTLAVPACLIYNDLNEDYQEQVLVQGIIDCLIDEGDGYVLVDYKTDAVLPGQIDETTARYKGQLNLYAMAVETILHRPVKEKYLYLFSLGQEVKCG